MPNRSFTMKAVKVSSLLLVSFIVAIALNGKPASAQTLGEPSPTVNPAKATRQAPPLPPMPPKFSTEQLQEFRKRAIERANRSGNTSQASSTTPPTREVIPRPNNINHANSSTSSSGQIPPRSQMPPRSSDDRRFGSTTPPILNRDNKPIPQKIASTSPMKDRDERPIPRDASSTPPFIRNDQDSQNQKAMQMLNTVRQRKENVAKQFEVAISNLKNLRVRIGNRIDKESQSGIDMTKAKQLLATADTQLSQLTTAINALKAYSPATSTIPTRANPLNNQNLDYDGPIPPTDSPAINLDPARKLVNDIQVSIKSSQKALNDVIVEIAHAIGLKPLVSR